MIRFFLFGVLTAFLAYRKGYNPLCWILSGGVVGLVLLAFLPRTGELSDDEKRKQVRNGNIVGIAMSLFAVIVSIILHLVWHSNGV